MFFFHSFKTHNILPPFVNLDHIVYLIMCCFFTFSGFLVFSSALELNRQHQNWRLKFFIRRFFRIVPLWWLVIFLYFFSFGLKLDQLLINLSFLFGFVNYNTYYVPIIPSWSLFVEESFYLLLPIIWLLVKNLKCSLILFCLFFLVSCLWYYLAFFFQLPKENYFVSNFPLAYWHYFILGIICYYLYLEKWNKRVKIPFFILTFIELATVVLLFLQLPRFLGIREAITTSVIFFTLFHRGFIFKFFGMPFLQWCGRRCYYIYIFHSLVIMWFSKLNEKFFNLLYYDKIAVFIELSFILLTANLVWFYFEKPLISFSRRIT